MIEIKLIDGEHQKDINLPNEPFALWGRMIPTYANQAWDYTIERRRPEEVCEMCFPDEEYDYAQICGNSVFIGAYEDNVCVGLAVLQEAFFKYMYLYDLKVNKEYRSRGIASMLMNKAKEIASLRGYRGIYTQGQDNNLTACLFYIKAGFHIGGLDTDVYKGTGQEGKADIFFYMDIE